MVLAALTALVLLADLARPGLLDPVRRAAADVAGPVQAALPRWQDPEVDRLRRERDALAAQVTRLEDELERVRDLTELERASGWGGLELLPARVVGFAPAGTPVAGRSVTLDVGEREGVQADQTVVGADGLVGRVVRTAAHTSDVTLLGDAGVVVGVRFGGQGALGAVSADPVPGLPAREGDELTLTVLGDSPVTVGDEVVTLGSPDSRPYAAGVPLGRVSRVDPDTGQLGRTAVVTPYVDVDTLDLVAVVTGTGTS